MALPGIAYSVAPGETLVAGSTTVGTTAASLGSQACKLLILQAAPSNTVDILLGSSSTQPFVLQAGKTLELQIDNLSKVYAKVSSGSGVVNWLAIL